MTNQPRMRYPDEVVDRAKRDFNLVGAISKVTRLKKAGSLMSGRCPNPAHPDRDASFVVNPQSNLFHCYSPSCRYGDKWYSPIDWMMDFCGAVDFNAAMEMLGGKREPLPAPVRRKMAAERADAQRQDEEDAQKQAAKGRTKAREIFRPGVPMKGTIGETYLIEGRGLVGLDVTVPVLRFHPDLPYWHEVKRGVFRVIHSGPAMLAAFQDRWGNFAAVHQTWLLPDGSGKAVIEIEGEEGLERLPAKKIRGPFMGCAIRLTPPAKLMYLGEGIETTGEIARLHRADTGAWVAGTMGNLTGRSHPDAPREPHPIDPKRRLPATVPDMTSLRMAVPDMCETEILIADGDTKDLPALRALLTMAERRIRQEGRAAGQYWPPGRQDLNDYGRKLRKADFAPRAPTHCSAMCESDHPDERSPQ